MIFILWAFIFIGIWGSRESSLNQIGIRVEKSLGNSALELTIGYETNLTSNIARKDR